MLARQLIIALLAGIVGVLLTRDTLRANRRLEAESLERQRAQESLRESQGQTLAALRQSDALKSALLSSFSHELRSPLAAIKTMIASGG